jgi:hypothetical protein
MPNPVGANDSYEDLQRLDTTQVYTSIKPSQLKRAVSFYETKATKMLSE